jgi:hypothetical protein
MAIAACLLLGSTSASEGSPVPSVSKITDALGPAIPAHYWWRDRDYYPEPVVRYYIVPPTYVLPLAPDYTCPPFVVCDPTGVGIYYIPSRFDIYVPRKGYIPRTLR